MSTPTSILIIGLDFDWTATNHNDKFDVPAISTKVLRAEKTLNAVPNLTASLLAVNPATDAVSEATAKLNAGHDGQPWGAVVIGFGLRGLSELTPLFEAVVNVAKDAAPRARLLFTRAGGDIVETVQRGFPGLRIEQ